MLLENYGNGISVLWLLFNFAFHDKITLSSGNRAFFFTLTWTLKIINHFLTDIYCNLDKNYM